MDPYISLDIPLSAEYLVIWLSGSFKGIVALALIFEYESGNEEVTYFLFAVLIFEVSWPRRLFMG